MKMLSPSRKGLLALTALCTAVGSILVVFTLTWVMVTPDFLGADGPIGFPKEGRTALFLGLGLLLIGVAAAAMTITTPRPPHAIGSNPHPAMFGGAIVGLGFVFLVDAILNLIAFSGFAKTGLLGQVFPIMAPDDGVLESLNVVSAIRLVVSLGMAVLGALFFVTNSLRKKRERKLPYSETKFWAGLWFRLGEAVLFTVVFFLALRHYVPDSEQLLPLVALLVGMCVTTGETLVFGIAQRVLRGAAALVGQDKGDGRGSDQLDDDSDEALPVRQSIGMGGKGSEVERAGSNGHSAAPVELLSDREETRGNGRQPVASNGHGRVNAAHDVAPPGSNRRK
jgi:hypothetical protein